MDVQHIADPDQTMTITDYAAYTKMSRTHLFKIVDRGDVPTVLIDGERRLRLGDLAPFEARRAHDRAELMHRFEHADELREAAIEELARLLP